MGSIKLNQGIGQVCPQLGGCAEVPGTVVGVGEWSGVPSLRDPKAPCSDHALVVGH